MISRNSLMRILANLNRVLRWNGNHSRTSTVCLPTARKQIPICRDFCRGLPSLKYRNIAKATHCFLIAQQLGKHLSFPPAGPGARNVLAMLYDGDVVVGTEVGYCVVPETESLDLSLT